MDDRTVHIVDADSVHEALAAIQGADAPIVFLDVTRKQIETMNVGSLVDRLMAFSDSRAHTRKLMNRVHLSVSGWDFDPRELYEIPEVVRYFRLVAQQWNFWLYFLDYANDTLGVFIRLMIDIDQVATRDGRASVRMRDPDQAPRLMQALFDGFNALAAMHEFDEKTGTKLSKRYTAVLSRQFG